MYLCEKKEKLQHKIENRIFAFVTLFVEKQNIAYEKSRSSNGLIPVHMIVEQQKMISQNIANMT